MSPGLWITVIGLSLPSLVVACSDSQSAPPPAAADASSTSPRVDGSAGRDPNANCVKPGTKNNDQGIGGYCETNADCVKGQSLCTGVFGAPENAWFCTRLCADDPNCGEGLYCANDPRGVACVPIVCGVADAGPDAGPEAGADAAMD